MKARDFDARFDSGEDISKYLQFSGARRPGQAIKRVNVRLSRVDDQVARQGGAPAGSAATIDNQGLGGGAAGEVGSQSTRAVP